MKDLVLVFLKKKQWGKFCSFDSLSTVVCSKRKLCNRKHVMILEWDNCIQITVIKVFCSFHNSNIYALCLSILLKQYYFYQLNNSQILLPVCSDMNINVTFLLSGYSFSQSSISRQKNGKIRRKNFTNRRTLSKGSYSIWNCKYFDISE